MAYIGNYLRGVSADTSMPSILGLQQYIQQGFDAGRAQGQNQQLAQLSQAAYNDTGNQQSQDVSRAIGIDPGFGYKLGATVGAQSAQQAQQAQLKRYGGVASAIFQAKQAGNNAGAEGLYQSVLPELAAMAAKNGGTPPPANLDAALADPKISGTMYQLAQMYGAGLPQPQKGVVIAPGGQLVNPQTGVKMAAVPNRGQVVGGYYFDPSTGTASPIPIQGAPNATGMAAPVQGNPQGAAQGLDTTVPGASGQRVTFNFPPGTPPEVIAAAKASAVANGDIAPGTQVGAPQGQPQTLAEAQALAKVGNQGVIAQRAQQIQALKARGVQMTPENEQQYLLTGKSSSFQGESTATAFGDTSLTGPQYVESIPAGNREIVKGLLNGTVALPSGTALKNPLWQSALASVKHADPTWNQAAYKQFADTRKFMTIGQGGQLINSINTAAQHLDKLREDIAALHNGDYPVLNKIGNFASTQTGGQGVTNFVADLTPVASELAAVYKGKGVPSDAEIAHFQKALTPDMSYGQQMNVIRGWIDLLAGKLNATREQYRGSMSKLSDPLSVINPRAAEALERITNLANDVSTTGRHAMPAEDTAPINAPGQQTPQAASPASSGVDSLLSKYGIQ